MTIRPLADLVLRFPTVDFPSWQVDNLARALLEELARMLRRPDGPVPVCQSTQSLPVSHYPVMEQRRVPGRGKEGE